VIRSFLAVGLAAGFFASSSIVRTVQMLAQQGTTPIVTRQMGFSAENAPGPGASLVRLLRDHLSGASHPRLVALTFDDGPYPVETPLLLTELRELHVPATFFLIGRDAIEFPELTARIKHEGHEIGNHTLTHPNLDQLDAVAVKNELNGGAAALERFVKDPSIRSEMRPPHGRYTAATLRAVQDAGYDMILWTEDPGDWRTISTSALSEDVIVHATAPDIILLHSGRLPTIEILPQIVARFRNAGYEFVTVRELRKRVPIDTIEHPIRVSI
jgi:peptidoglycan/xylan/chitin deacetylase (PgdA/CDA1 family)